MDSEVLIMKKIKPPIDVRYEKKDGSVRLNHAQIEGVVRKIIFDPEFLESLKKSMEAV